MFHQLFFDSRDLDIFDYHRTVILQNVPPFGFARCCLVIGSGYRGGSSSTKGCSVFSLRLIRRLLLSICPSTDGGHLMKVVSAELLHCKVTFFFIMNKNFGRTYFKAV